MRPTTRSITVSLALVLAAAAAQSAGSVHVSFVRPESFSDIRDAQFSSVDNLRELKRHLEELGARHVADGQSLTIEVLDVDLAGEIRFSRGWHENVRVLDGRADWPRIKFRITLEAAGQPVHRIERTVSDMAYLRGINRYRDGDMLSHEKRMLDDWFETEFAGAAAK
jgi:Protein of unknown function (DUF3016)